MFNGCSKFFQRFFKFQIKVKKRQQPNTAVAQKYFFLSEVLKKGSFTMTKKVSFVWQRIKKSFVFFEKFQLKKKNLPSGRVMLHQFQPIAGLNLFCPWPSVSPVEGGVSNWTWSRASQWRGSLDCLYWVWRGPISALWCASMTWRRNRPGIHNTCSR